MNLETVELMKLAWDMAKALYGDSPECERVMGRKAFDPRAAPDGYTRLDVFGHVLEHLKGRLSSLDSAA